MKKTVYIVLIIIMALVIVLTAVFLIKNLSGKPESVDNTSASPSVSVVQSETPVSPVEPKESVSPSESPSPSPTEDGLLIREETSDGVLYTITVPDTEVTYRVMINEPALEYVGDLDGHTFAALEDKNEYLKICFVPDITPTELAPSFLNSIIAFTEFEQSGQEVITGTQISGEKIAANDGETQVTAWLIETDAGVLAVVTSYTISKEDQQKEKLNEALATFEFKTEDAEGWDEVTTSNTEE